MHTVSVNKLGLTLGGFYFAAHILWSLLVLLGLAEPIVDFMLSLHSLNVSYSVDPFSWGRTLLLLIVASAVGYIVGAALATLWNWVIKKAA